MSLTDFVLADVRVEPGSRGQAELPVSRLPTGSELAIPVEVLHGTRPGPTIWLSGAVHGDEIVGVEIIRQVLDETDETELAGTIIAAPVVNVFGFVAESRYLPDRRDLNRSFPGSRTGSLAAQIARLFLEEVVARCDFGLDFHAGSGDRTNHPQVRGNMEDPSTRRLAVAFGAPLAIHSKTIRGSLREAAVKRGITTLLFEGGEPRRFSAKAVDAGVAGTLNVLEALGMRERLNVAPAADTLVSWSTRWVRAPRGGIFRMESELGEHVIKGQRLGVISGPSGRDRVVVRARASGVIVGHSVNPLVHRGDGLVHIALDGEPVDAEALG